MLLFLLQTGRSDQQHNYLTPLKALQLNTQQKLVVIGRKSFGKISSLRNKPDAVQIKINTLMKNSLSKDVFVDLQDIICGSQTICPLFTEEAALISFDGGHLTKKEAKYIGQQLFKNSVLSRL